MSGQPVVEDPDLRCNAGIALDSRKRRVEIRTRDPCRSLVPILRAPFVMGVPQVPSAFLTIRSNRVTEEPLLRHDEDAGRRRNRRNSKSSTVSDAFPTSLSRNSTNLFDERNRGSSDRKGAALAWRTSTEEYRRIGGGLEVLVQLPVVTRDEVDRSI